MNKTRYILLNCAVTCVISILGLQLFRLQVVEQKDHSEIAHGNALRNIRVLPARGSIYDRNGVLLVHNVPEYTITLTPKFFNEERIPLLAKHLGVADSIINQSLEEARKYNPYRPSSSFSNVSFEQYSRIIEDSHLLPGVGTEIKQQRHYPTNARSSHALGYVGEINKQELNEISSESDSALYRQGDILGRTGIERGYEPWLRGVPGMARKWVNVYGLEVMAYAQGQADQKPREYYDIHLSLDSQIQEFAESLFVNKRGAVVALDPNNGEIIALVSKPDYPLEIFNGAIEDENWQSLISHSEQPLYNRATMNLMPPGSTWKPFMALLGLSEGLLGKEGGNTTIFCPGYHPIGRGRFFRCLASHGEMNVVEAIQSSCNTFFFELARRMDISSFKKYANLFGFGIEAPIDIGEQTPGLIPDSAYFGRIRSYEVEAAKMNLGVGQGDMGVTPLQLARYASALANGGVLHPPHLVKYLVNPETNEQIVIPDLPEPVKLEIDSTYMNLVRKGMRLVMEEGTGVMAQIPDIPSAGKTGTAQAPGNFEDHSVFIMFAPFDSPKIAIAVQCENTGDGSQCAAPIASLLAEKFLKGEIPPSWRTSVRMDRALSTKSQTLALTDQ
ncbi:MAG: penicillin-binding protein 2 [Bacteroidetes bacterium]|nr:penicillin-binding protein 2 [Bacteroidota bacterium]